MTSRLHADSYRRALAGRLRSVAAAEFSDLIVDRQDDPSFDAAQVLFSLVSQTHRAPDLRRLWLLLVAVSASFPEAQEVIELRRSFELNDADESMHALLRQGFRLAARSGAPEADLELVTDQVLFDVDFTAQNQLNTGIQRVVRSLFPIWAASRPVRPVAWRHGGGGYRDLTDAERGRVLRWEESSHPAARFPRARRLAAGVRRRVVPGPGSGSDSRPLVVPWRTVVVLGEVPMRTQCARLACLAQHSGNRVVVIGYDCIPVVSADLFAGEEAEKFVHYLAMVKHTHCVAGISVSATTEFAGFVDAMPAQGLAGPMVAECNLPAEAPAEAPSAAEVALPAAKVALPAAKVALPAAKVPLPAANGTPPAETPALPAQLSDSHVLAVGSFEPRKNQLAVLHAAEALWRQGLSFSLTFVGGGGQTAAMRGHVAGLVRRGRRVQIRTAISDAELSELYTRSRFTVFASLHEGYGLPVAESLARNTPVLTTNYGSTAEIGSAGGAVLVDPRSDADLTAAMRQLLTDDELISRLRTEIATRPHRDWQDYGDELWSGFVAPQLASARAT